MENSEHQDQGDPEGSPQAWEGIITPHVTNLSPELLLIWRTRSLHDHDHILIGDRERRERIVTSLVTIANSETGGLICDHLLKHGAATIPELEEVIPTTRATASRTLKRLSTLNVVELQGHVQEPYRPRRQSGPRIPVFILKGAAPQAAHDAQRRYGELKLIKTSTAQDPVRQCQLPEAIALCKTYMARHPGMDVPNTNILRGILQENGIRGVDLSLLQRQLVTRSSGK